MKIRLLIGCLSFCLAGCAGIEGPPPIIKATGPYSPSDKKGGLVQEFLEAAEASRLDKDDPNSARTMLEAGFVLNYAHCNDFFLASGREQSSLLLLGDMVASFGTLAASAIALGKYDDGGKDALQIVTLGTSTALSGIDIYTQRFLFGAENVDAVRELTLNAASTHSGKVRELDPQNYNAVVTHLFDNQAICTPRRISILAREAIQKAELKPSVSSQGTLSDVRKSMDEDVLKDLGQTLNPPGAVSAEQAGALFWLLERDSTADERSKVILPLLSTLPAASNPFDTAGALKDPIPNRDLIDTALGKLSAGARSAFDTQIKNARAAGVVAGAAAGPLPTLFALPDQPAASGGRVSVSVK